MAKTIVGLFDEYREAQRAVVELVESGISREDIGITSRDYEGDEGTDSYRKDSSRGRDEGILNRFGGDVDERDDSYRQGAYAGTDHVETGRTDLAEGGEARIPVIE